MKWPKTYEWSPGSLKTTYSKTSPSTVATISYPLEFIHHTDGTKVKKTEQKTKRKGVPVSGPDSLLSWKVAFCCFIFNLVTLGMFKANSIIFVEYLNFSGYRREIASWPFSIAGLSVIFVAPFVGALSRHIAPRWLCAFGAFANVLGLFVSYFRTDILFMIIFFGLVRGVGLAVVVCLIPVFINQYFQRHRATAQGIVGAGVALGLVGSSFLIQFSLETYALRGTMLILAGVGLQAFVASIPMATPPWLHTKRPAPPVVEAHDNPAFVEDQLPVHPPSKNHVLESAKKKPSRDSGCKGVLCDFLGVLMNGRFVMIALTFVTITNAGLIFTIVIVDYAVDLRFTRDEGVYLLMAFSVGDVLGKLCLGWVTDKKYLSLQTYFALTASLSGGIFIGIPYVQPMFFVYMVAYGVSGALLGSALSLITLFYIEYLRKDQVPVAFSLYVSLAGLTAISRPPLIGLFRDRMGSYDNLFRAIGGTLILAAIAWVLERLINRMRPRVKS